MTNGVRILGADGNPLPERRGVAQRPRTRALSGGSGRYGGPPYDAADLWGQHMAAWQPYLWSPDAELNMYRDRIVSRVRDMVRNDGWASGAVTRILDNAVGANLRPIAKPDYRFIQYYTDNKAFDHVWSKEFSRALDANWRSWAVTDQGHYCDAARNQNFGSLMYTSFRHLLVDGDALAVMEWLPRRIGRGRARYATAVQLVDPDRLSNPQLRFDQQTLRGGVEVDELGSAIAYHIRKAHAGDWFSAAKSLTWVRVPRETEWGRANVVHTYEPTRATQHRGGAGIFTPVLQRMKMLIKYDGVELDSAILNSIFGAYIESPFDRELVGEALDDGERLSYYQDARTAFHDDGSIVLGNARVPILFPGEKINSVAANRPAGGNFAAFEGAVLRNVATSLGLSAQQVTNDWSNVNYSSARGALLEAWKTLARRRDDFAMNFAAPIRTAWMEESIEVDDYPWPTGPVPDFVDCRGAFAKAKWLGPGMGWMDPVAEAQGAVMRMDGALSTLEDECAQQGLDFEDVLEQRRYELGLFEEYDIPTPAWAGELIGPNGEKPETLKRATDAK